ncbi:hypothetical protein SAMN04489859_1006157 [Paracoccus alcaliphilus]|uniref:Uncharacterized protein n=1 Tax=Paracoccus alcaliphilus TaxID=34002 RepID=A0A1H8GFQ2_9RHOB|nr:hypothetical protein [Paracoccus alcaliphilus]WCR17989.1 hypothetical protein JHW40_17115 [Paracoccus alcaliphilus]SEN42574.1 hypothetical protein SAMN04489859_1006157 [Paracoccus alcaliphilus]
MRRTAKLWAICANVLFAGHVGTVSAEQVMLPLPEAPARQLTCEWGASRELTYDDPANPEVREIPLGGDHKPTFTMWTDGRALSDISLSRWADWMQIGSGKQICTENHISITCGYGPTAIVLDRRTLRGVELNTFSLFLTEETPSVQISNFLCRFTG